MKSKFTLEWDAADLAKSFKITETDVRLYFTDGRRVSFIIERRLVLEHPDWRLASSEGAGYDLLAPDGSKWEVRSLTRGAYISALATWLVVAGGLKKKVFSQSSMTFVAT